MSERSNPWGYSLGSEIFSDVITNNCLAHGDVTVLYYTRYIRDSFAVERSEGILEF